MSSIEDSNPLEQMGKDIPPNAEEMSPGKAAPKTNTSSIKSPGSPGKSPQEVIQHFKPQSGPKTVANASRLPDKIMAILQSEEAPQAIWWLQKGTAFAMQKEKFQAQILDKHFRGNKFKSLVRNLHRWGFKRMTCDATPAGKTIAFSHKHFRQDKPELVHLIQITKEKDAGDAVRERREALRAAMPSATSPPSPLRFSDTSASPLREERQRAVQGSVSLLPPANRSLPRSQQPSLANFATAEHNQNLTSQGHNSLLLSLTSDWKRNNPDSSHQQQLQPGLPFTTENAGLLAQTALRGRDMDQLEQMRPDARDPNVQRMQILGSMLPTESASFQHQRRDALLQQHLVTSSLGSHVDAHRSLILQQHLAGRSVFGGATALHTPSPSALMQYPQMTSQILSQRSGNSGGWDIEQLLSRSRNMNSLQQQQQQQRGGRSVSGSQQDVRNLSSDELRYLAELRRRGS